MPIQVEREPGRHRFTLDLSGAEMELINEAGREFILRELLSPEGRVRFYHHRLSSFGAAHPQRPDQQRLRDDPLQTEFLARCEGWPRSNRSSKR